MYVAVKGGETAILNSYKLLDEQRRGDSSLPELTVDQIRQQLKLSVDRVMTEGSVYDPELAALAIKQASGDLIEAIFLLRAYRATLPRLGNTCAIDTSRMQLMRRISATFKDLPGGQVLGPTYDYTQRLLDFTLMANAQAGDSHQSLRGFYETHLGALPFIFSEVLSTLVRKTLFAQSDWLSRYGQPIPGRFGEFLYREQEFSSRNQSCFQRRQVKQALIVQGFLRSIIKPAPTSKTIPHQAMVLGISPHTTKPMTTAVSKPT